MEIAYSSLAQGGTVIATQAAQAALVLEPLYESAVRVLDLAEMQCGNAAAAVRAFEGYQRKLREDMGLQPSESLLDLATSIFLAPPRTRIEGSIQDQHLIQRLRLGSFQRAWPAN